MRVSPLLLAALLLPAVAPAQGDPSRAFTPDDMIGLPRVGDPSPSPDGKWVAYTVTEVDPKEWKATTQIWLVPAGGGEPRRLTHHEKGANHPRWSPDSRTLAFVSSRSGASQVWLLPFEGGEPRPLTSLSTGASDPVWSPTGTHVAFTSKVYPDAADDAGNRSRAEEIEKSGLKIRRIERLLYRHWDEWQEGKRPHVFVVEVATGKTRDVNLGDDADTPVFSLGGPDGYAFSPDGREIAFTRGPSRDEAWSTNADLWVAPVDGSTAPRNLTAANPAWDGSASYSPDGKWIAYRFQQRPGFESDRFRLGLIDRSSGTVTSLASDVDQPIDEVEWAPDSRTIYANTEEEGRRALWAIPLAGGPSRRILSERSVWETRVSAQGGFFTARFAGFTKPNEVWRFGMDGSDPRPLTRHAADWIARKDLGTVESVHFPGALGASIQAWLVKPPRYDPSRRHPLLLLVHGGPQGAWLDAFSSRWNPQVFAARGYVVLMPNPHGSTGFGQAFTDQISRDWGGACYEDCMRAVDWAIEQGIADPERLCVAGASFGGYMANWINGHTDRFKAIVTHAGVYNLPAKYSTTEELWFPEWDIGGTPWDNPEAYAKWSPHTYAKNMRTPTLITHGDLDFRVPVSEGMGLFTALQRQGVPSRMVLFPDEGHWILKPKNARAWIGEQLDWLDRWVRPSGGGAPAAVGASSSR
ncbi:MAG: S9 family peptidase [Planctomycetes bacterium]|nr:S9 family peptidase [Planctomycetota bacterium]